VKISLFCRTCGAVLSRELDLRSTRDPTVQQPMLADGQPVTPRGTAYKSHEPLVVSPDPAQPHQLSFVPQLWFNPDDVDVFGELVDDACRVGGCCGLSGHDGPNIRCKSCKSEIGTKMSDCWTPYLFIADPERTELRKTES